MVDKKDKSKPKVKGVDVSEYMPPGPVSPYPPMEHCPSGPVSPYPPMPNWPDDHMKMDGLIAVLHKLKGQQVTVYVMGMGPAAPITTIPIGTAVVPGAGTVGITGIVSHVGMDYLELRVLTGGSERVVYIPLRAVAAVVPGGPLMQDVLPNVVTTSPQTAI